MSRRLNALQGAMLAAVLAGATLTACVSTASREASDTPVSVAENSAASTAAVLELQRGACRGRCPQYRVALFDDGGVHFDGGTNVQAVGVHRRTVTPAQVQALLTRYRAPVLALKDSVYMEGEAACGAFATDLPTIELVIRSSGAVRRFTVNAGCRNAPAVLGEFARAIDSVALAPTWTGGVPR